MALSSRVSSSNLLSKSCSSCLQGYNHDYLLMWLTVCTDCFLHINTYSSSRWSCLLIRAFFLLTRLNHSWIYFSSSSLSLPVTQIMWNIMLYFKSSSEINFLSFSLYECFLPVSMSFRSLFSTTAALLSMCFCSVSRAWSSLSTYWLVSCRHWPGSTTGRHT